MNTQRKVFLFTSALGAVLPGEALAAPVDFTVAAPINVNNGASPFFLDVSPDIVNADALLSIDGGTVSGFEFSTFRLYARFDGFADQQIHQYSFPAGSGLITYNLSSIPLSNFTEHTLAGFVFEYSGNLNIPAGTELIVNSTTIPEPGSATLWVGAVAGVALAMRRRRHVPPADGQGG